MAGRPASLLISQPGSSTEQRSIPGLDGLRAVSIALVLVAHLARTAHFPAFPRWWWHLGDIGLLGVRIFFIISGFLITHLLLLEEERTSRISLKQFYIRRAYRILPALLFFLLAMLVARAAGLVSFATSEWLQGLTFSANYSVTGYGSWNVGHLWSLSVEEQFYLLWPALLALSKPRFRMPILFAALAVAPAVRLMIVARVTPALAADTPSYLFGFFSSMDALALGCMLALMRHSSRFSALMAKLESGTWTLLLPVVIVLLNGLRANWWLYVALVIPLSNVAITLLIHAASRRGLRAAQRILDSAPARWVGRLSYSLYLWQQPFLNFRNGAWFTAFPINLLASFVAAAGSYYLVEQPVLRMRRR